MKEAELNIILFDGVCNLCNHSVQFIIKHDKKGKFRFASLQSNFGKAQISKYQIDPNKTNSVIFIKGEKVFTRSSAALKIVKDLNGLWPILYIFIFIPPFIRNFIYDFIAKNRYKWFGKKESCMVPLPELKSKFLK
jgi:predicted DCC family thiol-disulfide oxidoreductase YuxK